MTQYTDRHDIAREIEFSKSCVEDRINLVIFTPKKQNYGSTYDMPISAAEELYNNLGSLIHKVRVSRFASLKTDSFEVSTRTANILKQNNITSALQLVTMTEGEFLMLPNTGRKALNEVKGELMYKGFRFGMYNLNQLIGDK